MQMQAIFSPGQQQYEAWKEEMHSYEKSKRTKIPFGKSVPQINYVTNSLVKAKEVEFNPILQTFQKKERDEQVQEQVQQKRVKSLMNHLKNTSKYEKSYDILNLHSSEPYKQVAQNKKLGPIRNAYNVINNQKLPDFFFKDRDLKIPQQRDKKLIPTHQKQYNIVTNIYKNAHQERAQEELQQENQQIHHKYWKTHNYDPVYGKFYDSNKETNYQQQLKIIEAEHGKDLHQKLPPSYVFREPFISDFTKPLPESLKILDQKNQAAKKRFQLKYVIQDQYERRNVEEEQKHEHVLTNKVHFGRILDEKSKEFDIINNKAYPESRAEELYRKKLEVSAWDQLLKDSSKNQQNRIGNASQNKLIKTAGFNT